MAVERALPLVLGVLSVSSGLALLTFDIIFSRSLTQNSPDTGVRTVAIVASSLEAVAVTLLVLLAVRHIRYRNGSHIQDFGHGRKYTYILAGIGGTLSLLGAATSATMFGLVRGRGVLPEEILGATVKNLVAGGFVAWAVALVSQAAFVFCMAVLQRRDFQQQIQPYRTDVEGHDESTAEEMELPSTPNAKQGLSYPEKTMSRTPPSSSGSRSRADSDAMGSIRSSFSQAMRPASSKSKLISKSPYRGSSIDSHPETIVHTDDGFDSWDTSTVDAQSRHAVESASPTPPRFLETIPASPTNSRSPSPGCPLDFPMDLEPPPLISRRRSRSLAGVSYKERSPRATSPESPTQKHESHIHPLFRTDSPEPPPSATPGTIVTAAPGAGQLISDRQSLRSLARMRSGSLPSALAHSASLDSIRLAIEREERDRQWSQLDLGGESERTLTPPIPDFVLNGTPRSSMSGYTKRKTSARGTVKGGGGNEI